MSPAFDAITRLLNAVAALKPRVSTPALVDAVSAKLQEIIDAVKCLAALQQKVIAKSTFDCTDDELTDLPAELQSFVDAVIKANADIFADSAQSVYEIAEMVFSSDRLDAKFATAAIRAALSNVSLEVSSETFFMEYFLNIHFVCVSCVFGYSWDCLWPP